MTDSDEIGVCPFFPQHKLTRHRLPQHIIKCEKYYTGPPLERCIEQK